MEKSTIKKLLKESLGYKNIYSQEYQDKFYLYKEIQEILPDIAEEEIYDAINEVNKSLKSPVKGKKFVEAFVEKLTI